jgi:two-component system, NtrC family, sensor histidine kinase KinB
MLRTRLVLGLLCLLVILLAMGLYSIDRCSRLGVQVQIILKENQVIGLSVQEVKRCITRTTAALLSDGAGESRQSNEDFNKACARFDEALKQLRHYQPDHATKKLADALEVSYRAYRQDGLQLLELPATSQSQRRVLAQKMARHSVTLLDTADELLDLSQKSMESRNQKSGKDVNTTIRLMILGMITAVVVAIYASFRLSRGLFEPISSLTASIQQIGEGNLDQTLVPMSNDELGTLARSFNKMASQLKDYRAADKGRLARLNRTVQQTISSFPDPIFVLNQQHEVEFRNPTADALAVKLLFAGVGRLPEQVETLVKQVMESKQDFLPTLVKDAIRFTFDNREHFYMPRIILLREESGNTFGVAVILEDITQARLLDEVKTNLISTVSHELKTPITSLRMALHLLLEKEAEPLSKTQESLVKTAREDTERLLRTLDDLLDLTRLEQGPAELQLENVSPGDLIQAALQAVQEYTQDAATRIRILLEPGLPEVLVDRQRIAYVFNNLLTNALKYSPPGTEILFSAGVLEKGWVEFSVRNTGPAISREYLNRIFDKFYRVPGTKKPGSGLGLSICQEIVRAHQGHLSVTSDPETGTLFQVGLKT